MSLPHCFGMSKLERSGALVGIVVVDRLWFGGAFENGVTKSRRT